MAKQAQVLAAIDFSRHSDAVVDRASVLARALGAELTLLFAGATAERILEEAVRREADWIVLGSHGRSALASAFLGSVSRGVLSGAQCPVVVVPSVTRAE
jgi:nucleotide-binding universal stress UspA family protein